MEEWYERAKARMKDIGLTQEGLAEAFGMTPAGIQKWLAGVREPSLHQINTIADILKVPRTWLTHGLLADATIDGLPVPAQQALRTIIAMERAKALPSSFWDAIRAMTEAMAHPSQTRRGGEGSSRDGTNN